MQGVMSPQDARLAVDAGAAGIVVSNHGGRQLDHCAATLDMVSPAAYFQVLVLRLPFMEGCYF